MSLQSNFPDSDFPKPGSALYQALSEISFYGNNMVAMTKMMS